MQDKISSREIKLDKSGCSEFRYGNKCQRGYFLCDQNCNKCFLNQKPIFRNLKPFTPKNIGTIIW